MVVYIITKERQRIAQIENIGREVSLTNLDIV